jgi:hypothetical protein
MRELAAEVHESMNAVIMRLLDTLVVATPEFDVPW